MFSSFSTISIISTRFALFVSFSALLSPAK
jgi:hypothetical protein